MLKILGAKNCRKNPHKHPGPPFQIRRGPGSFSNANISTTEMRPQYEEIIILSSSRVF